VWLFRFQPRSPLDGDALMAIFGAPLPLPDHSAAAVRAALDMVELLNTEHIAADRPAIRIGAGIATGEMVAGYTGTQQRATYTCIGGTVNLAARLDAHTKLAKRTILIDPATCMALSGRIPVEPVGAASFRGKAAPVEVYAVTDSSAPANAQEANMPGTTERERGEGVAVRLQRLQAHRWLARFCPLGERVTLSQHP
jgi:class 3 adenylate cyclase